MNTRLFKDAKFCSEPWCWTRLRKEKGKRGGMCAAHRKEYEKNKQAYKDKKTS